MRTTDEHGMSRLLAFAVVASLVSGTGCGAKVAVDSTGGSTQGWGCVQRATGDILVCECSAPPPSYGETIAASACAAGTAYACCAYDGTTCGCTNYGCTEPSSVPTCADIEECPTHPVAPKDGDACTHVGLACHGIGSDPVCFYWTCTCQSDGHYACHPDDGCE